MNKPVFLLCPPDHFDVSYVINPWMNPDDWTDNKDRYLAAAKTGWHELVSALEQAGAEVLILPAKPKVPDMVFTANAAVVLDRKVVLAHFRHPERQPEQDYIASHFKKLVDQGVVDSVVAPPADVCFEGAGDAVWDETRRLMWMGYGPRSDLAMQDILAETYDVTVQPLKLVDPRFYHLDTALCVLSGGEVLYYPPAFDDAALTLLRHHVPSNKLIAISDDDAALIAANGVCIGKTLISGGMTTSLQAKLNELGYQVTLPRIDMFAKSGGSAYCLTLRLDRKTNTAAHQQNAA